MGMSDNMLACIRAIAENRIQDAKQYAICCCVEDGTKKNEGKVQYYKKLLENGSENVMEVPMNIKGLVKTSMRTDIILADSRQTSLPE